MLFTFLEMLLWGTLGFLSFSLKLDFSTALFLFALSAISYLAVFLYAKHEEGCEFEDSCLEAPEEKYPEFYRDARALAEKADIPLPRIGIIRRRSRYNNAVCAATGDPKSSSIYICESFLSRFDREELKGIFCHELGHAVHQAATPSLISSLLRKAAIFMIVRWLSSVLFRETYSMEGFKFLFLIVAGSALLFFLARTAFERRREFIADAFAAALVGKEAYTKTLRKLGRMGDLYTVPIFQELFEDHPSRSRRIKRLKRKRT